MVNLHRLKVYHWCGNKGGWGDWLFSGSRGSVVSALAFQSLILSSIPGWQPVFIIPSYLLSACVSRPSISTSITRSSKNIYTI